MWVCAHNCVCHWRPEDAAKSVGARVTGGCELIIRVPSTEARSSREQFILMTTEPPEPSLQSLKFLMKAKVID